MPMQAKINAVTLVLMIAATNGCRTTSPQSQSDLRHLEGDVVHQAPAFMWQRVPEDSLQRFINSQADSRVKVIPQNSPITIRLQEIVDQLDTVARKIKPTEMEKVPKPVAVVLDADRVNAFVTSRAVCVKQWIKKEGAPDLDPTTIPADPNASIRVIDMSYPGDIYETTLSSTPPSSDPNAGENSSNCKVVEPDSIGWDLPKFIEMYNSKLPSDKQQCRLGVSESKVTVPSAEGCGVITSDYVGVLRYDAQANVVFFFTGLLKAMNESSVATVAAHELSHIYRAHSPALTAFEPYFFLQTDENELQRPIKTEEYEDTQKAMMDASYLDTAARTEGARFDANLFWVTSDLRGGFLSSYCQDQRPCKSHLEQLSSHVGFGGNFDEVWENIGIKPLQGEVRDLYLKYEQLLVETLEAIQVSELSSDDKEKILEAVPDYLKKYFAPLEQSSSLVAWFENADRAIVADIPNLKSPFEAGAQVGLGFYSPEEEADEVGFEIAARSGISGDQVSNLWLQFMAAKSSEGFQPGIRETSYDQCLDWRNNSWKDRAQPVANRLLIDSLSNIHHGMCYRLYNSEREWHAHGMSNFAPVSGAISFDQKRWKNALESSLLLSRDNASNDQETSGTGIHRVGSAEEWKHPQCIFSARRVPH